MAAKQIRSFFLIRLSAGKVQVNNVMKVDMTKTAETVSVLIPTYHRTKLLRRAVDSVFKQSSQDFVIRISDNGTDDETRLFCEELSLSDKRVFYSRNSEDIGAVANFRKLISEVETELYCILSDDDFLLPNFLSTCARAFRTYSDIALACTRVISIIEGQRIAVPGNQGWSEGYYRPSRHMVAKMSTSHFISTGTVFRREVIDKLGGFHDLGDDRIFAVLASACCPFYISEEYGAVLIVHDRSYSRLGGIGGQTSINRICQSAGFNFAKVVNNVAPELQADVNAVLLSTYVHYLRQRLRQERFFGAPYCAEEERLLVYLGPITMRTIRELASVINYNVPKKLGGCILRAWRRWEELVMALVIKYPNRHLDPSSSRYLQGDLAERDSFLRHLMTRMDNGDR